MEWTSKKRLAIIKALAAKSLDGPQGETHRMLMERIMFLCDMPAEFLEKNKRNYEDAIKLAQVDVTIEI